MPGETNQRDRVALAAALRSIAREVVRSRRETGLETEAVTLDLQFALDSSGADIEPVVFLEPPPRGVAVHRLRCTLRLDGVEQEVADLGVTITDEPKRSHAVTLPPQAMPTINDEPPPNEAPRHKEEPRHKEASSPREEGASHADERTRTKTPPPLDKPPREEVATGAGVLLDAVPDGDSLEIAMSELEAAAETKVVADPSAADEPEPEPERSERKRPQIVLPTNPRLKLRKASDSKPRPHPGDERPAQRTELEFDSPEERERPQRNSDEPRPPDAAVSPFLIFDHQIMSKRAVEGEARDGEGSGSASAS